MKSNSREAGRTSVRVLTGTFLVIMAAAAVATSINSGYDVGWSCCKYTGAAQDNCIAGGCLFLHPNQPADQAGLQACLDKAVSIDCAKITLVETETGS